MTNKDDEVSPLRNPPPRRGTNDREVGRIIFGLHQVCPVCRGKGLLNAKTCPRCAGRRVVPWDG